MVERCQRAGAAILEEAGVKDVQYHDRLRGWAYPDRKSVRVPTPTTRRRLYIVAHEAGHVALNHIGVKPQHRQEYEAERYAHDALRRHGISVPKKSTQVAKSTWPGRSRRQFAEGQKPLTERRSSGAEDELSNDDQQRMKSVVLVS